MRLNLEHWLKLDDRANQEARRLRILLYVIGAVVLFFVLASWVVSYIANYYFATLILGVGVVISLGLIALNWMGYLGASKIMYPAYMIVFLMMVIWSGEGAYDEALLAFPALIAMAGLLLGRRGVIVFTFLSVAMVSVLGYGELGQTWPARYAGLYSPARVTLLNFMITLSGLLIYLAIDNLVASITRLRQDEQTLASKNRELEDIRASLEVQVSERTGRAEEARCEAEQAQAALQQQLWQIAGQEKLNEILRGEQSLEILADKVMSFLCRYVDASFGALFVYSEAEAGAGWQFAGGFACRPGEQTPGFFRKGEGLIGQAAVEKRSLSIETDAARIRVTSGLGETIPTHLFLLPLLHFDNEADVNELASTFGLDWEMAKAHFDNEVGVIEMAGVKPFSPEQVQFLNRSAESIAITIHNLRIRRQLHKLLDDARARLQEINA